MLLPESLVWALDHDYRGASWVSIFCDAAKSVEIADFFIETFDKYWNETWDEIYAKKEYDGLWSPAYPPKMTDFGFQVRLDPMCITFDDDYCSDYQISISPLYNALDKIREKYPDISYEGYISFTSSDEGGGDVINKEISSVDCDLTNKVYDFIGERIAEEMNDMFFWDCFIDHLSSSEPREYKEVIKCFHAYQKWLPKDPIEMLLKEAEELDEEEVILELKRALETGDFGEEKANVSASFPEPPGMNEAISFFKYVETTGYHDSTNEHGISAADDNMIAFVTEKAQNGDEEAQLVLADYLLFAVESDEEQKAQAVSWLKSLAANGNADAQNSLARIGK